MFSTPKKPSSQRLHPVLGSPLKWLGLVKDGAPVKKATYSPSRNNATVLEGRLVRVKSLAPKEENPSPPSDDLKGPEKSGRDALKRAPDSSTKATSAPGVNGSSSLEIAEALPFGNGLMARVAARVLKPVKRAMIQDRRRHGLARQRSVNGPKPLQRSASLICREKLNESPPTSDDFQDVLDEFYDINEDPDVPPPPMEELIVIREIEKLGKKVAFAESLDETREEAQNFIPATEHDKIINELTRKRLQKEKEERDKKLLEERKKKDIDDWFAAHGAPGFPHFHRRNAVAAPHSALTDAEDDEDDAPSDVESVSSRRISATGNSARLTPPSSPTPSTASTTPPKRPALIFRGHGSTKPSPASPSQLLRRERSEKRRREEEAFGTLGRHVKPRRDHRASDSQPLSGGSQNERLKREDVSEQPKVPKAATVGKEKTPAPSTAPTTGRDLTPEARFIEYEKKWELLQTTRISDIRFKELPWPVLEDALDVDTLTKPKVRAFVLHIGQADKFVDKDSKFCLRAELVKWHPDKFLPKYLARIHADDRDMVITAANHVTKLLLELGVEE